MALTEQILVVDDIETNRDFLKRRLERQGYTVVEADDGDSALARIAAGGIALVLLDVAMPRLSGMDVLASLRETHSADDLPVIMVTAHSESERIVDALMLGANDYVTKPVDFTICLARVQAQLHRRRATTALEDANRTLEERINERTRDLNRANAELDVARRKAEEASRAKSQFLARMSHELRTPLNAIIGFAQIIRDQTLGEAAGPIYREYAGHVNDSGQALLTMINGILEFTRLDAGNMPLEETTCPPAHIVDHAMRTVTPLAVRHNIRMETRYGGSSPLVVDVALLRQGLVNILSNAVQFSPEGGLVTVTAEANGDGEFVFSVEDKGIGMSADEIETALIPFAQVDDSLSRGHDGTGLGLPFARLACERHDGRLAVTSAPGQGTRVDMILPASRVKAA